MINYKNADNIILKILIVECLKVNEIWDKIIEFITEVMKDWKVELTAGEKPLAGVKTQCSIFEREFFLGQFKLAMMSFAYIFRKCRGNYKFTKSHELLNHFIYMDNIKLFIKKT